MLCLCRLFAGSFPPILFWLFAGAVFLMVLTTRRLESVEIEHEDEYSYMVVRIGEEIDDEDADDLVFLDEFELANLA